MIGSQTLCGVHTQRVWADIFTIENFLTEKWPMAVVELGTGTGAFSAYLAMYCHFNGGRFLTIDAHRPNPSAFQRGRDSCLGAVGMLGGCYLKADVFDGRTKQFVREVINSRSPAFVYCDNGDKRREVLEYAPVLRRGDFLGVHDYGHEIHEDDLPKHGWIPWRPEFFEEHQSTNRILERV